MANDGREADSIGMGQAGSGSAGQVPDGQAAEGNRDEGSKSQVGFVYFIETEDHQYVKIGYSKQVITRLSQLSQLGGVGLRLLGCIPGSRATEAWLHRKFAAHRHRGEWFRDSEALRQFISIGLMDPPQKKRAKKNRVAQALVAMRNQKLTPEERREIAKQAAAARWKGHKAKRPASARKNYLPE